MAWIYLIAAPEDAVHAEPMADWLKQHGHVVRTETGHSGYPPARDGEVTLALWSRAAMMSARRFLMTNRAIDAWEQQRLVMVKLDHGLHPHGLADVGMIDLTFEPARTSRFFEVDKDIRAADSAYMQRREASLRPDPASIEKTRQSDAHGDDGDSVFISYAHADAEAVYPIVDLVEASGRTVWIDRDGMKAGQGWAGMIVRAIKSSQTFCIMCSARSFASDHVRREVYLADKYRKALLPIRLDDAEMPEDIEYFLIDRQWIDIASLAEHQRTAALRAVFGDQ